MSRKSSRRDFLRGRAAADAMADAADGAVSASDPQPLLPGAGYTVRVARSAMACEFEVFLNAGQYPDGTQRAIEALDLVDTLEDRLSFFRPESQLSEINRRATEESVAVEPGLFQLLGEAVSLYHQTEGALDITSTPLWECWGFARREGSLPAPEDIDAARQQVGGDKVELDDERKTVRLRCPGMRLNLGSIGKGYALDRCAETLDLAGIGDFLLHAGGSSILTRGRSLASPPGWPVGIPHPLRPGQRLAEIRLIDRALATSGSRAQSFVHEGRRYSHILDPRTGWPAEGLLSVTVVAEKASTADALSTALFVMGPERAAQFADDHPELGILLILPTRQPPGYETRLFHLEDDQLRWL
jgi:thiamine biosynthesis lipoprotein